MTTIDPTKLSNEITDKYTVSNNTFVLPVKTDWKDRITTEIGDSKQPDFYPQIKIQRWDNEVNFSARLVHDELTPTITTEGNKIKWQGDKIESHFYDLTKGEGGYEFEVILKEKPKTNVLEFTLVDKDVKYFYQPPLTEEYQNGYSEQFKKEIVVSETQVKDLDGNVLVERPENVVSSYAVYASEQKTNWVGGKIYRTGQMGMIYRPKIIDSVGTEVWGDLHIENGILSVTIPQDFLDNAVYPVRHAAGLTFGYTSNGASYVSLYNLIAGSLYTLGVNALVSKVTVLGYDAGFGATFQAAIYDSSKNKVTVVDNTVLLNITTPTGEWKDCTFNSNYSLMSGNFYLFSNGNKTQGYFFYTNTGGTGLTIASTYLTYPNTISGETANSYLYSIYATYTEGGGGATYQPRHGAINLTNAPAMV
jgi:hypothetical protein